MADAGSTYIVQYKVNYPIGTMVGKAKAVGIESR